MYAVHVPLFYLMTNRTVMPQFRWPSVCNDLALDREVAAIRPSKPSEWEEVAAALNSTFSTEERFVDLKGRGCRERMERLIEKFRADDAKSLRRYACERLTVNH